MMVQKIIGEERKNRTEHILSRAVSRTKLLYSSLLIAIIVSILMCSLTAIGLWSAASVAMEEPITFITYFKAAIVYVPAIWIMIGIATLFIGFFPRFSSFIWVYLFYSFIVIYLGKLLQFPDWLNKLSPFGHIPQLPVEEIKVFNLLIVVFIAFCITLIGMFGYNKRDIEG